MSNAVAIGKPGTSVATLAQDYAFGRDGVTAFKEALAPTGAKLVHEEYAPPTTTDFTASHQRLFDALQGAGPQDHLSSSGPAAATRCRRSRRIDPEPLRHRDLDRRQHPAGDGRLQGLPRHGRRRVLLLRASRRTR